MFRSFEESGISVSFQHREFVRGCSEPLSPAYQATSSVLVLLTLVCSVHPYSFCKHAQL